MSTALPQKKEDELRESINKMVDGGIDQARLDEILFEAKRMQEIGGSYYSSAKRIMGMVAALRGDVAEVNRQFNAAIVHDGRQAEILNDYATSLFNLHHNRGGLRLQDELVEMCPDDMQLIRSALKRNLEAGNLERVKELKLLAEKLNLPMDAELEAAMGNFDLVCNLFSETDITWEQVCARAEQASDVLHRLKLYSPKITKRVIDGAIFHEYFIDASLDAVIQAEDEINTAIAELPYSPVDNILYFSCARYERNAG